MLRVVALLMPLLCSPVMASECFYASGDKELYFVTPMLVAVADKDYRPPYACYTSSLGTGVDGRLLGCSDGYEGPLVWTGENTFTFRGESWKANCDKADDPLGIR